MWSRAVKEWLPVNHSVETDKYFQLLNPIPVFVYDVQDLLYAMSDGIDVVGIR